MAPSHSVRAFFALLLAQLALAACPRAPERPAPAAVEVSPREISPPAGARMAAAPAAAREEFVGVVLARQAVAVSAEGDGRLATVDVRVGDWVTRGTRLASLDTQSLAQDLAMAQASVGAAAADARRAEVELQKTKERRARREAARELFSQEDLAAASTEEQVAAAALDTARARVAQEKARQRQLQERIARSVLRAPIDGRVALRYLDAGALVHAGTPVVRLISSQDFLLRFAVPPERAGALRKGSPVEVRLESPQLTLPALVSRIAPQIDPASQMIFVEADLAVPPSWTGRLQDGQVGRVALRG
jgi:RND family efflux transporter MFP subunit